METLNIKKANALCAYNKAEKKGKELLENLFGKDIFSQKITEIVKTFEDACINRGYHPETILPYKCPKNKREYAMNDYARLDIIAEALQQDFVFDWSDSNQRKWRVWFEHSSSGFGFSFTHYVYSYSVTTVGSRLCMPTEELAIYFGKQFIEIHNRLLTNNY